MATTGMRVAGVGERPAPPSTFSDPAGPRNAGWDGPSLKARSRNPVVSTSRLIELVDGRRQASIRYNRSLFLKLQSWYLTYRGVWQGRISQFRNNISIPFVFAMIQSDVARKVQTSFGTWPIVTFQGYGPSDSGIARKNEVLISAQMKDDDSIGKAIDFFLQADIGGTAVARYGWKNVTRKTRVRQRVNIAPGLDIPVVQDKMATEFDGPHWQVIDRLDFLQQPAKQTIDDMDWVIHQYWVDYDTLLEDANSSNPYYDPDAVRALKDYPATGTMTQEWQQRRLVYRNEYEYMYRKNEQFAKPVHIWEMHGLVPSEFAPDGIRHRVIAIANQRVVVVNREGPFGDKKPFLAYSPMPDPFGFDGVGKAEIAEALQRTIDRMANQKLDALDLLIDPMWIASAKTGLNLQNMFTRAGKIMLTDGEDVSDSTIRPLSPDMRGFQAAYQEISSLFGFMQLGTGETDAIMGAGGGSGNRETARGFLGRQENALTRLAMETTLAEERFIEPLANAFRDADRRYLSMPKQIKIIGSLATVNPITGLPYPQEEFSIDYDDLIPDYRARAVGASQMLGKSQRRQDLMTLMQAMASVPMLAQSVSWGNFARQLFATFDFHNVDELLVTQVPAINQIAQQTGNSPQQVAQVAGTPLEQLNPDTLGQMMNTNPHSTWAGS